MARGVRSEALDRLITIARATTTQDEFGTPIPTWTTLAANIPAGKSYRSAKEGMTSNEVQAMRVLRFLIRWSDAVADVGPLDRIEYPVDSGTYYDISEANEVGRREGIELFAQARSE